MLPKVKELGWLGGKFDSLDSFLITNATPFKTRICILKYFIFL